jgi:hypothetical protein
VLEAILEHEKKTESLAFSSWWVPRVGLGLGEGFVANVNIQDE